MNNLYKPSQSTGTNKSHATAQNVTTFPHNSSSSNEMHDKSTGKRIQQIKQKQNYCFFRTVY
jgi:hypothetical protein